LRAVDFRRDFHLPLKKCVRFGELLEAHGNSAEFAECDGQASIMGVAKFANSSESVMATEWITDRMTSPGGGDVVGGGIGN
jgi:hypothetical protein